MWESFLRFSVFFFVVVLPIALVYFFFVLLFCVLALFFVYFILFFGLD